MWRFGWINFGWNNQQEETGSKRAADTSLINKIYSSCFVCLRCCLLFGNSDIRMHWFTITRKQRNLITSFWLVILRISSKKEMIWRKQPKATSEECSQYSLKKFKVYKTKVIYISIKKPSVLLLYHVVYYTFKFQFIVHIYTQISCLCIKFVRRGGGLSIFDFCDIHIK